MSLERLYALAVSPKTRREFLNTFHAETRIPYVDGILYDGRHKRGELASCTSVRSFHRSRQIVITANRELFSRSYRFFESVIVDHEGTHAKQCSRAVTPARDSDSFIRSPCPLMAVPCFFPESETAFVYAPGLYEWIDALNETEAYEYQINNFDKRGLTDDERRPAVDKFLFWYHQLAQHSGMPRSETVMKKDDEWRALARFLE